MDNIFLYRGFGIRGQEILGIKYADGSINVHIRTKDRYLKCTVCGSKKVTKKGYTLRSFLAAPVGLSRVRLIAHVHRLHCIDCGKIRQEQLSYADPKKSYTHSLENYIGGLLRTMTVMDAARNLEMSWNTVKEIQTKQERANRAGRR